MYETGGLNPVFSPCSCEFLELYLYSRLQTDAMDRQKAAK